MISDELLWLALTVLGGSVLYSIMVFGARSPGRQLQSKFQRLGVLAGRNRAEIEAVVGTPSSVSATANGRVVCQWMATGYHIALLFAGDSCEGVSHEFSG